MAVMVKYHRQTGAIVGVWESTVATLLAAQEDPSDPVHGYQLVETALTASDLLDGAYMQEQVLTAKTHLTLEAVPNPFPGDGRTRCAVTVVPFVPCVLLVDSTPYSLVPEDATLLLTADVPHVFDIRLAPLAAYRAIPIQVEAT